MLRHCAAAATVFLLTVPAWSQDLPGLAAGILDQTEQARRDVAAHSQQSALEHIRIAASMAGDIQTAKPNTSPILVPVYSTTQTATTYTPIKKPKAPDYEVTTNRMKKDTSIREVEADVTTTELNVTNAANRLTAARVAVEQNDWTAAENDLAAIPAAVVNVRNQDAMPLLKAKQNLELAKVRVLDGKYKDAVMPLRAAAEGLADYERVSPGPHAQDAEYLRQQLLSYSDQVTHHHDEADVRIDGWLDQVNAWYHGTAPK